MNSKLRLISLLLPLAAIFVTSNVQAQELRGFDVCAGATCCGPDQNRAVNGSFESPAAPVNGYRAFPTIPGWVGTRSSGELTRLEIWNGSQGTMSPQEGEQHLEINDNDPDQTVSQEVAGLTPGSPATFCFWYVGRPGFANNSFTAALDGGTILSVSLNPPVYGNAESWQHYSATFTPTASTVIISFTATQGGTSPGGAHIDNVSVCQCGPPPTCPDIIVDCTDSSGAFVTHHAPETVTMTCFPPSGWFPIGVSPVTCTLVDGCGNTSRCTFSVTVRGHGNEEWKWARQAGWASLPGGPAVSATGNAVAIDKAGNVIVTGFYEFMMSFPSPNPNFVGPLAAAGPEDADVFLAKYDTLGNPLWAASAGGTGPDEGNSVAVDDDGNSYITGRFTGNATFGSTPPLNTAGDKDIFVAKFDADGVCVWARNFGGPGDDRGAGIAVTPDGNDVFVTGDWSVGGTQEAFVLKIFGGNGLLQRPVVISASDGPSVSPRYARGRGIALDPAGDLYIVGVYGGATGTYFGAGSGLRVPGTTAGDRIFFEKFEGYSLGGAWMGHSGHGSATGNHDGTGIAVDASGAFYITGNFHGTDTVPGLADFGDGSLAFNNKTFQPSDQLSDYLIAGFDAASGTPQWALSGNGPSTDGEETRGIALEAEGHPCVTGFLHPNAAGHAVHQGPTVMVKCFDRGSGEPRWELNANDTSASSPAPEDIGLGIAIDHAGCVHVTGAFTKQLEFASATTLVNQPAVASWPRDMFVAKMCPDCCGASPNLVDNGSFESPDLGYSLTSSRPNATVPGWNGYRGSCGDPLVAEVELWNSKHGLFEIDAQHAWQHLEISSDFPDQTVCQTVTGLTPGCPTTFSFWYTGRPGFVYGTSSQPYDNHFIATLSGGWTLSAALNPEPWPSPSPAVRGWHKYSVAFTPNSSTLTIAFSVTPTKPDDAEGAHIDNVSLTQDCCGRQDADGDGMEDGWEIANGLDPNDPSDAGQDPDGDGSTNLEEYHAGTSPHMPNGTWPTIITHPQNLTAVAGEHVQLEVLAQGPGPLTYDWRRIGAPAGTFIGTNATLTLSSVQPDDAGTYFVIVSSPFGSVSSESATLTVDTGCTPPPFGMVHWWHLDEPTGAYADDIAGTANNGGIHKGNPTHVTGVVSGALNFSSSLNQYVEVPNQAELNLGVGDFTIDAWIRLNSFNEEDAPIVSKWNESGGYYFLVQDGNLTLVMLDANGSGVGYNPGAAILPLNVDLHVAVTVDRDDVTGVRFYVNGALYGSTSNPTTQQAFNLDSLEPLRIGASRFISYVSQSEQWQYFDGLIDEVEIFTRVLADTELNAIFQAGSAGKCKTMIPSPCLLGIEWLPTGALLYDIEAGSGVALNPRDTGLSYPIGLEVDANGDVLTITSQSGSTYANSLVKLDRATGTPLSAIPITVSTSLSEGDMAIDPSTGDIYFTGLNNLYRMDGSGGPQTFIGPVVPGGAQAGLSGIAFDNNGRLFAIDTMGNTDRVFELNPKTAAIIGPILTINDGASSPASVPLGRLVGFDFEPVNRMFYLVDSFVAGANRLFTLDVTTGAVIPRPNLTGTGTGFSGLAVAPCQCLPDLWIKDTTGDIGTEPNTTSPLLYISDDIWVRNSDDPVSGTSSNPGLDTSLAADLYYTAEHQHQNPAYYDATTPNYLYVKVRNRGCAPSAGSEVLRLYWANASLGLNWESDWTEIDCDLNTIAIDPCPLPQVVPPQHDYVVRVPWIPPAPSAQNHHFCLLARIETLPTAPFGMTFAEGTGPVLWQNVKSNNNIAWKNVTVIDGGGKKHPVLVRNVLDREERLTLRFGVPEEEVTNNFHHHGDIIVELGAVLLEKWEQGGQPAIGWERLPGTTQIRILDPVRAEIGGLLFAPGEVQSLQVRMIQHPFDRTPSGAIFNWDIVQLAPLATNAAASVIGGERYAYTVPLHLHATGLMLEWEAGATLQNSSNLRDWFDLPNATSPHQVVPNTPGRFFRVRGR